MKKNELVKNQELLVTIEDLTYEGMGVAKVNHYPLFISDVLPGEEVVIKVLKVGKSYGYAKALELKTVSPDRVSYEDEKLIQTGIAPLIHMNYTAQLKFKDQQVETAFTRMGKFKDLHVNPIIGMEKPVEYRNKAQIPVRKVDGILETGFFRKNTHDLVKIDNFFIQDKEIDQAITILKEILRRFGVKPYCETSHTGNLRNIIIRRGHYSHEMMIILVTRTEKIFRYEEIIQAILAQIPEVVSIIQNINPDKTNVIMGKKSKLLYGKRYLNDTLLGKDFRISAHSFYQINTVQAEKLYEVAIAMANLKKTDIVFDAYCGIGTIALSLADKVKEVYGVEIVEDAIKDAQINAEINEVDNAIFRVGDAQSVLSNWIDSGISPDVIIADPPRKGLTDGFIEAAIQSKAEKIVYISCNPSTLARDCRSFVDGGYKMMEIQPVDMFPYTPHVETVVLMSRAKE